MAYNCPNLSTAINVSSAPTSGAPMTICAWLNPKTTVSGVGRSIVQIESSGSTFHGNYLLFSSSDGVNNILKADAYGASSTFTGASGPSTFTTNQWVHCAGVFTSTTSRQAYLNGTPGSVDTANCNAQDSAVRLIIGYQTLSEVAEISVWNVALTAAEIASLAKGVTCDKVRPQSLVFYAPLIRNLQDVRGGRTMTTSAATVANHPRIYK